MLSLFPDLLTYGFFAPLILRLILGASFALFGYNLVRQSLEVNYRIIGLLEIVGGILIFIGLWTQAAVLVLAILILLNILGLLKKLLPVSQSVLVYQLLLLATLLSLLLTGAGAFAFDLPL